MAGGLGVYAFARARAAECTEAREITERSLDNANTAVDKAMKRTTRAGWKEDRFFDFIPGREAGVADLLEPRALVVAHHPRCFTSQERIDAEVEYQSWRRWAEEADR